MSELLGEGRHRRVYAHENPDWVLKVQKPDAWAHCGNREEWDIWCAVRGTGLEPLFVPCVSISEDDGELVQVRVEPCTRQPDGPEWLMHDTAPENWGVWRGATRRMDYADPAILKAVRARLDNLKDHPMAEEKQTETKTRKRTPPARKPKPWWDGLSPETAQKLERMGYKCKADAMMFVTERARFINRGKRALYDPLHISRPWLRNGMPFRVPREVYDEVRQWLGAEPLR